MGRHRLPVRRNRVAAKQEKDAVLRTRSMGATIVQAMVGLFVVISGTYDMSVQTAEAIPAFARKYTLNCTTCHTAPLQINTFGERFLENGYQLPGTEDGGVTGKKNLSAPRLANLYAQIEAACRVGTPDNLPDLCGHLIPEHRAVCALMREELNRAGRSAA